MKVFKSAVLIRKEFHNDELRLTTASEEVEVAERKKKLGSDGCIWSKSFPEMAGKEGEWITDQKYLRAGVSVVMLIKGATDSKVILNRFDSGHPTAAGKLTPPAGLWNGQKSLIDSALDELGEEVILTSQYGKYGFWLAEGPFLAEEWVKDFTRENGLKYPGFLVNIYQPKFLHGQFSIYLDGEYQGMAFLAFEPENGGIEIMFPFTTYGDIDRYVILMDGEKNKNWLHREVNFFTSSQIEEERKKGNLTSKALVTQQILEKFF